MKKPRKKVPYKKPSKRNPLTDVYTDAARRAKILEAEKDGKRKLRAAMGEPTNLKGQPLSGHALTNMAASQLAAGPGPSISDDFRYAAATFFPKLRYMPGGVMTVSNLWHSFLSLMEIANPDTASEFSRTFRSPFQWYLAGELNRINSEYDRLPEAILTVEVWNTNTGRRFIAVQRDEKKRELSPDAPPEHPMLLNAGGTLREFISAKDLAALKKLGLRRFLAAVKYHGKSNPQRQ